jgi:hypothetical protein
MICLNKESRTNQNQLYFFLLILFVTLQISLTAQAIEVHKPSQITITPYPTSTQQVTGLCQTPFVLPNEYLNIQNELDSKIRDFANLPAFAKKADELLSKLITAKSPVIVSWMNKRDLQSKSEEDVIREWRKYFAFNFVIAKYPYNETQMDLPIEFLFTSINKIFAKNQFQAKMEALFKKAQLNSIETLKKYKFTNAIETQILSRVQNTKLYWAGDLKSSKFKNQPLEFFDWGIAYDPTANEINMGINALKYPNDETYLAVFSHELAHSFDSCRWGAFFTGPWPFEKVGNCLRAEDGPGAKKRDDSYLDTLIKSGKMNSELAQGLKLNPTCNKTNYPPEGVQADQLPETFADWFSAEAMSQLPLTSNTNLRADLCEEESLNKGSSYLSNRDRLIKIYFTHPVLKNSILNQSSKSTTKYCSY